MNIKHDREKVIQKGLYLFNTEGYNALGVEKICKTTGMTKGAFYNAFKSKENFLLACLSNYCDQNIDRIIEKLTPNKNKPAMECLQDFYFEMLEQEQESNYTGCLINNIMSELGGVNLVINKATNIHFNSLMEVIEPTIIQAQKDGDISKKLNAKEVFELIHSTFFGVLTWLKGSNDYQKGISTMQLLFNSIKNK